MLRDFCEKHCGYRPSQKYLSIIILLDIKLMIPAVVVMMVAPVVCAVALVPDVCKLRHRGGLPAVDHPEEFRVDRAAVAAGAVAVDLKGLDQKVFVACHDVGEVPKGLRCVAVRSNVDVDSAAAGGVALRAGFAEPSAKLLSHAL